MSSDTFIYRETRQTINSLAYTLIKKGQNYFFLIHNNKNKIEINDWQLISIVHRYTIFVIIFQHEFHCIPTIFVAFYSFTYHFVEIQIFLTSRTSEYRLCHHIANIFPPMNVKIVLHLTINDHA